MEFFEWTSLANELFSEMSWNNFKLFKVTLKARIVFIFLLTICKQFENVALSSWRVANLLRSLFTANILQRPSAHQMRRKALFLQVLQVPNVVRLTKCSNRRLLPWASSTCNREAAGPEHSEWKLWTCARLSSGRIELPSDGHSDEQSWWTFGWTVGRKWGGCLES